MKVEINSFDSMSNRQYQRHNNPKWWVRIGSGDSASFLPIPGVRGDEILNVSVDAPENTEEVFIGVGPKSQYGIREMITIKKGEN